MSLSQPPSALVTDSTEADATAPSEAAQAPARKRAYGRSRLALAAALWAERASGAELEAAIEAAALRRSRGLAGTDAGGAWRSELVARIAWAELRDRAGL
jgi:hypothetical protein